MQPGRYFAGVFLALGLAACTGDTAKLAERDADEVQSRITDARDAQEAPRFATLRLVPERPYVGLRPLAADPRASLPERFRRDDAITLPLGDGPDDATLARRLQSASGLTVRLRGPAPARGEGDQDTKAPSALPPGAPDLLSPDGGIWTGPLDRLLDIWTRHAGYSWRHDEDGIAVLRQGARLFHIHALAGQQTYTTSASAEGGEGAGATQSIATSSEHDPWPGIEEQLKALAAPDTVIAVSPTSATVLARGRPRELDRVRGFLDYLNREVLRPVTLSVHIYTVTRDRESKLDIDLTAYIDKALGTAIDLNSPTGALSLIRPRPDRPNSFNATVDALASAGTASRLLSADIPSLNGKPAQFFELYKEAYLKERATTVNDGVSETELTPGTVSSGFSFSYLPRITGPDEVLVRLFASLQDRPHFQKFRAGSPNQSQGGQSQESQSQGAQEQQGQEQESQYEEIQFPAYGTRALQVTQKIGQGETLMITGFSDAASDSRREGSFFPGLPLPKGGHGGARHRREHVMLVTARIGAPLGISEAPEAAF